jgi:uncharacterized protein (DUF1015 family)
MCYAGVMPRFEPFPGLRYDNEVAPLAEVLSPPYDVVDESLRAHLAERSPYNAIHLELPVADEDHGLDRYAHAAALLRSWEREGVLRADDAPSLYIYRMRFREEDLGERVTTGVIGALGLDVEGGGEVLPHERTMPKPKGDRLDLLRATKTNLSPIWCLSLAAGLAQACGAATHSLPAPMHAQDEEGVIHELWPVTDPEAIAQISALVGSTPVVIADGHHRYETATFYRNEVRATLGEVPGPHDLVMALVVELTEDEVVVRPTHRLISALPKREFDLLEALEPFFKAEGASSDLHRLSLEMNEHGAIGLVTRERNYLLVATPALSQAAEADLDSSRLDLALAALPAHEILYQHGARLVAEAVAQGRADAGFLLRPATVAQIAETARSGHRMPPKTTYFHPKPRTGLVFRRVAT